MIKDWKLKLRYGKLNTPYKHFTVIAPGVIEQYKKDFDAQPGKAYVGMKIWAMNEGESADAFQGVADQIGFKLSGNMEIYETPAESPPTDNSYAYGINFSYYTD
jgi:hypothetical protein